MSEFASHVEERAVKRALYKNARPAKEEAKLPVCSSLDQVCTLSQLVHVTIAVVRGK